MDKGYKKMAKCDVCKTMITIDKCGNGECKNCGWRQSEESFQHPLIAGIRNIPSLKSAVKQYNNGKSAILANFNDFVNAYENYGEVEFTFNNTRYGVLFDDKRNQILLLNIQTGEKQYYSGIEEFILNAKLNGSLLKDIWKNVTNTDFLQNT